MYAGDHSASDQHHGDQGNTVYAGDQRHLWQVAPQRVRLHQHSASTHLCQSSLINEDSSSPSSLNYFYKYSVLSKLYAG